MEGGRGDRVTALLAKGRSGLRRALVRLPRAARLLETGLLRLLVRGRCLRPLRRKAPADRGGVGEGGFVDPKRRGEKPLPVGRRSSVAVKGEPRPAFVRHLACWRISGRRERVWRRADAWGRL